MKLAALVSGGKDSILALIEARKEHEISVIVAIKSENPDSYMYHVANVELVKLQAESMDIPLIFRESEGVKEEELNDLREALIEAKGLGIEGVVSGAIFSNYQKDRISKICDDLELKSLTPLWNKKPRDMWKQMIDDNWEVILTVVAAEGLDKEWLGKKIDKELLDKLLNIHDISSVGEGGEFESLVLNCPLFKKKIEIIESEKTWDGSRGELIVKKAKLS